MSKYFNELPNSENGREYPQYMDSADMYTQERKHFQDMKGLRLRLLKQIEERGYTNCGMTSVEQVENVFGQYK